MYRDAQERIRKRVKEDMRTSIGKYDEMRHTTLPRAKKAYEKRCEEVEQMKLQQQAIDDQRTLLSATNANMSRETSYQGTASPPRTSAQFDREDDQEAQSSTEGTSPRRSLSVRRNHNQGHGRRESSTTSDSGGKSPRLIGEAPLATSPASGEKKGHFLDVLRSKENWEAARKEAPKKLNALLSRMREGGNEKNSDGGTMSTSPQSESSGGALSSGIGSINKGHNIALKSVKAKRESEEADQAYRKAVFDLETLRLRREKTVSAAIASVVYARKELYLTCQAVWLQAERSNQILANDQIATSEQASQVIQRSLDNMDEELKRVESRVPSLAELHEDRIPYINYYFGECKDLLFGVSLIDYAYSRAQHDAPSLGPSKVEAPLIVRKCIAFIEEKAMTQPGIYRISAKHTAIQDLAHALERDEQRFQFNASQDESATVAGVLKLYLRQLPEAVLPIPWEERVKYTHERQEQIQSGFAVLKSRIRRLPAINLATLKAIVEHLARVASYSEQNKMTVSNLSIVFGPLLLSQADHETTSIAAAMEEDRVTEDLILYCQDIFDLSHAGAPVLPPLSTSTKMDDPSQDYSNGNGLVQEEIAATPTAAVNSSSNKAPININRVGSLKRSNAVTKGVAGDDALPHFESDKVQVMSEATTRQPVELSTDLTRQANVQPKNNNQVATMEPTTVMPATIPAQDDAVISTPRLVVRNPELDTNSVVKEPISNLSARTMYEA